MYGGSVGIPSIYWFGCEMYGGSVGVGQCGFWKQNSMAFTTSSMLLQFCMLLLLMLLYVNGKTQD